MVSVKLRDSLALDAAGPMNLETARFEPGDGLTMAVRSRLIVPILLVLASLAGCARGTLPAVTKPTDPIALPVPIVSQASSYSCGAAALLSALLYFGAFDGPETELHGELGVTPEQGTHPDRIVASARRHGLVAEKRQGATLADVQAAIADGALVLLAIQAWPDDEATAAARGSAADPNARDRRWDQRWDDGHYVVAVGLDDRALYVMDPSVRTGYGYIPRDELLRRWHDCEVEAGRRVDHHRLAIVIRGTPQLRRYPDAPIRVE